MIPISKKTAQKKAANSEYKLNVHSIANLTVMESLPGKYPKLGREGAVDRYRLYKKKNSLISQPLAQDAMTAQYLKENPRADPSSVPQMVMPKGTYQDELQVGYWNIYLLPSAPPTY